MNIIICGSKRHENLSFDRLVDSFDTIVRHNMLLPNNNYGERNSDDQVFNGHIYDYYIKQEPLNKWILRYHKEYGITKDHIESFYKYIFDTHQTHFVHYINNNTKLMQNILKNNNIDHKITKQLSCGLASVAQYISQNIKPFLIGYSLEASDWKQQQYSAKSNLNTSHDSHTEIYLIKQLHQANLIDATFCTIEDSRELTLNSSLLTTTTRSLDILKGVYK